jgi:hypothetical protein
MSLRRLAVVAFSVAALACGTAQAQAVSSDGPRDVIWNGGDVLRCTQIPILPLPVLSFYEHPSDCSHSGVVSTNTYTNTKTNTKTNTNTLTNER